MTASKTGHSVSRRAAFAGLGAGGLGLALANATRSAAQDAAVDMATHPLVGLWQFPAGGPDASLSPWVFQIFHADGILTSWDAGANNVGLGLWRPTGARTAEALRIVQDLDTVTQDPYTLTARFTAAVDETGDTVTQAGDLDIRDRDGNQGMFIPGLRDTGTRITFEHNPATGSLGSPTPEASATPAT